MVMPVGERAVLDTRPAAQNGLGLSRRDAIANVEALRSRLELLAEDAKVHDRLMVLLDAVECRGKQVHDANVIATMLVHGIDTIVTANVDDFARFGDSVEVVDPRAE